MTWKERSLVGPPIVLWVALLLAGCDEQNTLPPNTQLPPFPAELASCLQRAGVTLPKRALTVGEVEKFWKTDRQSIVAMRLCGARIEAWYGKLRKEWR